METQFGKFLSKKIFPRLFWLLNVVNILFSAYITERALCRVFGLRTLYGLPFFLYILADILIITQKRVSEKWPNRAYKIAVSFLSCLLIYQVLYLILWEIVVLALQMSETVESIGVIGCTVLSALTVLYGYLHTKVIACPRYTIALGQGGRDYHIVLLSDIHLGVFVGPEHVRKVVDAVNALSPDLVVIAGDLVDVDNAILHCSAELEKIAGILREIRSLDGVYVVLGNHDPNAANEALCAFLSKAKITLLHNQVVQLPQFHLIGRTDAANNLREPMEKLLSQIDSSKPVVVLDHDPQGIREAAASQADLVLSGHTHRGQFFPVTLFTRWANGKHHFYGQEQFGRTHAVISSGAGFFQLPVRIGTSNEVVDIHLLLTQEPKEE